jgi:hypothetical protein
MIGQGVETMSEALMLSVKRGALLFAIVLVWGMFARPADALVGGVLWTVNVPAAAQCGSGSTSGTAVAVVPGGKLNLPKIQTMLVTSCVQGGQANLFFLDPSTIPATLVTTIPTTVTPTNGWESLAARPDMVDLIGCGMMSGVPTVYSISYSSIPPNTLPLGTATLLFTGLAGSTCQGLAWDVTSNPKTVYESSSSGAPPNILHLTGSGVPSSPPTISSDCAGSLTGVAVGVVSAVAQPPAQPQPFSGSVLFAACPQFGATPSEVLQINKSNGTVVLSTELPSGSFALPTPQPGDVECDAVTFGLSQSWHPSIRNRDVLWVKGTDAVNPHNVYAMELPFAACGPVPPPPTPVANACDLTIDTDGDGLPDCWEDGTLWSDGLPGIALDGVYMSGRGDTQNRFTLCAGPNDCATPFQRDVFVEIDYMQFHAPNPLAVSDVVTAFASAPAFASNSGKCDNNPPLPRSPGCTPGVRLHVQIDEQVPHVANTALAPCTGPQGANDADFSAIKSATEFATGGFGTLAERSNPALLNAKSLAFHYSLFVHNQSPFPPASSTSASGCAKLFGNDVMVSLGGWTPPNPQPAGHTGGVGSRAEQGGTFMHELGHNLGLRHGGIDNVNCKPQHLSIMNYAYQFPNIVTSRPLSYSSATLGAPAALQCLPPADTRIGLNEACLQEASGIGNATAVTIAFGPPVGVPAKTTITSVAVVPSGPIDWNKNGKSTDIMVVRDLNSMTSASGGCPASPGDFLEGSNDWQILQLNLRASTDFAGGVSQNFDPSATNGTQDATLETTLDLSHDLIDIKPNDPNNTINSSSTATFQVAMFSRKSADGTSVDVDATTIDPFSITLRGISPGPEWSLTVRNGSDCKVQDVNKDGVPDLVCKFTWQPGPVVSGTQRAVLSGTTSGGYDFLSSDNISFVP